MTIYIYIYIYMSEDYKGIKLLITDKQLQTFRFQTRFILVLKYLHQQSMCIYIYALGIRPKDKNIKDIVPEGEIKTPFPGK